MFIWHTAVISLLMLSFDPKDIQIAACRSRMSLIKVNCTEAQKGGHERRNVSPLLELSAQLQALPSGAGFVLRPPGATSTCSPAVWGQLEFSQAQHPHPSHCLCALCPPPWGDSKCSGCFMLGSGHWELGRPAHGAHTVLAGSLSGLTSSPYGVLWLRHFIHPQL